MSATSLTLPEQRHTTTEGERVFLFERHIYDSIYPPYPPTLNRLGEQAKLRASLGSAAHPPATGDRDNPEHHIDTRNEKTKKVNFTPYSAGLERAVEVGRYGLRPVPILSSASGRVNQNVDPSPG
jgi:hypothetical protein